jgi:glyceraldehyde 3-phosphate dehydrogenase
MVDLTATLSRKASAEDINAAMKKAAEGALKGVLNFTDEPVVSIDFNHSPWSSTVDGGCTIVIDDLAKVVAWYDNEWGFSQRMVDVAKLIATKG